MKVRNAVWRAGAIAAGLGLAVVSVAALTAHAQAPMPLKIGVMEGFSGVYGDLTIGEVEAMQLALEDVGGKVLGRPVEILSADHQTKPDVGAAIARKWYDVDGVKMITGLGTSSVALAVRKISQEKGLIDINTGAASADLTGPACSATGATKVVPTRGFSLAKGCVVKNASIFAAISGSSAATCATIAKVALPELVRRGYDEKTCLGSLCGAGTLGILLPPSIIMVVYAVAAEVSILKVFLAGFLPGFLLMALFSGYIVVWALLNPDKTPKPDAPLSFGEKLYKSQHLIP
mgnify:CR=1 FL=1